MSPDIFGNLREWGEVPNQLRQLAESKKLDEHQEGLIRILRYRDNWRLRELVLDVVKSLESPSDELLGALLDIMMDDGVYCEARVLAAHALSQLAGMRQTEGASGQSGNVDQMIEKMNMLLLARKAADSLGAKIGGFEVPAELAEGEGGYAKALPFEWLAEEREAIGPLVAEADILILSALVPGETAPVLVTEEMVGRMKPGSVVVDVAIDQGGNCVLSEAGREIVKNGVSVCGLWNIPGSMPVHSSWLYANNMLHYVKNLFKDPVGAPDLDDEIVQNSLVTYQGQIVHKGALKAMDEI